MRNKRMKVGDIFYQKNDRRKYYIVSILDEPKKQIVYKFFGIHKQWWHYQIESEYRMNFAFKIGLYSRKRSK